MSKTEYDALTTIQSEIERIPGYKKATSTGFFVCCPFHDERTPSCHVTTTTEAEVGLGVWHCFAAGTKVITKRGTFPIEQLVGEDGVKVITGGNKWVKADFKSYGMNRIWELTLIRGREVKTIRTTKGHRWHLQGRKSTVFTERLLTGDRLRSAFTPRQLFSIGIKRLCGEEPEETKSWIVKSVDCTNEREEVYCTFIPKTNNFTLDGNILTGNCFGCGEKGGWNKLADKAGLETIDEWKFFDSGVKNPVTKEDEERLLGSNDKVAKINKLIRTKESIPWPEELEWRGYDGKIIKAIGGIYYNDIKSDELMVGLPVNVNGKTVGAVKAFLAKKEKRMSYITSEGSWVKDKGLFPYDLCRKLCKKRGYNFVVLVEGPRDALRLLKMGIPALACLGTQAISKKKVILAMSVNSDVEKIWVMSDNDKAGTAMWKNIKGLTQGLISSERILLPKEKDNDGQLIKVDPDSCPSNYMNEVKRYLLAQHL